MIPLYNAGRFLRKSLQQPLYAARVLAKRAAAYFYYIYGSGKSSYPESLTLFLTYRCNLRCRMCGQWGRKGITKKYDAQYVSSEIPADKMKLIIDDVVSFRPNITLFGGEPLLYPGCAELIKHIKSKNMHCLMITNGSLLEDCAKDIVESGLDELNVSLDGKAELHDSIRGLPGLFDSIMRGLKKARSLKRGAGEKPLVNLQCTITRDNYKRLDDMLDVAEEAGAASLTFHNLIFLNSKVIERQKEFDSVLGCDSTSWEGFDFDPGIDPEILYKIMGRILSTKKNFSVDFYPNFSKASLVNYYKDPEAADPRYSGRCVSPWIAAYIFPDGEVRPCLNSTYSYGSVLNSGFAGIWNDEKAVKFRSFLRKKRSFSVCARCTEIYRY